MDNSLKKRLALIKARANRFRRILPADRGEGSTAKKAPAGEFEPDYAVPAGGLEELVRGEPRDVEGRQFYLVRARGSEFASWALREAASFRSPREKRMAGTKNPVTGTLVGADPIDAPKEKVCFFDIETAGLTPSTYVFLCGMMFLDGDDFIFELAFARDYDEEGGMLHFVRQKFEDFDSVVTFNGKSFDMPFVKTRMAVNRIEFEENFSHVDLLYFARRAYTGVLENCKLQTIEVHLRKEERKGDIPGRLIPAAYHDFVRTGEAGLMSRVIYHNQMDLLTMALLYNQLWPGESVP